MNLPPAILIALLPLSWLYGEVVRIRTALYAHGWLKQKRLSVPVISVGNLTVGGTGKTPMVLWLAERFLAEGKRVGILSRGYRGSNGTSDEIELLKSRLGASVVFGVGPDRYVEGHRLESQQRIDVFLLDDGFQHLQLARDVDILLMDASRDTGRDRLLPSGRLREPISAMARADVLVFTRTEAQFGASSAIERLSEYPVFAARTRLVGYRLLGDDVKVLDAAEIGEGPFFAFCGLGNPQAFFRDLEAWGVPVCDRTVFADHHRYMADDIRKLQQAAKDAAAKAFVTTEKDAQNLSGVRFEEYPVYVSVIEFEIASEEGFLAAIENKLRSHQGVAA